MSTTLKPGLYIHIPFCRHRCGYCAFSVSTKGFGEHEVYQNYIQSLEIELKRRCERHSLEGAFSTLYIGGGTPSSLDNGSIILLFSVINRYFPDACWKEITFECNPEDIYERPDIINTLSSCGVTRLSIGIQTLSLQGLKVLERSVDPTIIYSVAEILLNNFSGSVSYDFILGWPGQSISFLENDDSTFLKEFPCDHISSYLLNYEPGTRLERDRKRGHIIAPESDDVADIWEYWQEMVKGTGMNHYEISSFCRSGHESCHNIATWKGAEYLGVGSGAVSRVGSVRWTNVSSPLQYMRMVKENKWPVGSAEYLTSDILWQEELLLGLRHSEGIDIQNFSHRFGFDLSECLGKQFSQAGERGDLLQEASRICFTSQGWNLFDGYISDWMLAIEEGLERIKG